MYKIAILGCENSHADNFLALIRDEKLDIEVVGVYSHVREAAEKLNEKYGVYADENYDEFVGKIDGVVITARHGDNHYKYAKPYIRDGIPMFIDKPITVSESDAEAFKKELVENGVKICGGSICIHADYVLELEKIIAGGEYGKVLGGTLRAPISMENEHGGFYFYSQHLVEVMCRIFGYFPNSVKSRLNGDKLTFTAHYDDYDVNGLFVEGNYIYSVGANLEKKDFFSEYGLENASSRELHEFYDLLCGKDMKRSCDEIFAPVFILNAIDRSMQSGCEEKVNRSGV